MKPLLSLPILSATDPETRLFAVYVLALLVVWKALSLAAAVLRRHKSGDDAP